MFFPKCLGVFLAVVCTVYGAPTSSSFKAVIQESVDDVQNLLAAKAAVAQFTGEAVGEAALATGSAAVDFVASIDPIEITDDLEAAVIDGKINSIKAVFDAKRALLEALAEARARHQAQVSAFFNTTVEGVGAALDTTVEGISATKEVVADIAAEITLENAKDAIVDAFNQANIVIQQTVEGLLNALVETKQMMHQGASNFDSKMALRGTKDGVASALRGATHNAEDIADKLGLFSAIDSMVQGIAQIPVKVKESLSGELEMAESSEGEEEPMAETEAKVDVTVTVNGDVENLEGMNLETVIKEEVQSRIAAGRETDMEITKQESRQQDAPAKEPKINDGLQIEKVVVIEE